MKQYRITSSNFVQPGESRDPDAYMDPAELRELKKLAGIDNILEQDYTTGNHDPELTVPNTTETGIFSSVGSNTSTTGQEKRDLERQHNIRPGSDEWFRLWFSKPFLTGEKPIGDSPAPKKPKS